METDGRNIVAPSGSISFGGNFSFESQATIGAAFGVSSVKFGNGQEAKIQLWDTGNYQPS